MTAQEVDMRTRKNILAAILLAAGLLSPIVSQARTDVSVGINFGPPPAPVVVAPPPPPQPTYIWSPGYYGWDGYRYVWVDGRYIAPRPGYLWVPAHWERRGPRHFFVDGRWVSHHGPRGDW